MADEKLNRLREFWRVRILFGGVLRGVDSVLRAHVAHEVLGERMLAVIADRLACRAANWRRRGNRRGSRLPAADRPHQEFANADYTGNPSIAVTTASMNCSPGLSLSRSKAACGLAYGEKPAILAITVPVPRPRNSLKCVPR
ncbi:MAG: hypothetical protein CM1200mP29_07990 [Verrucomicrobiota bacterium]|nr:MAG: hypothetical protein CM1200mP29_07990 [Verrucomicrobiota bacterium]